jgi:hypothetical protein
MDSDDSNNYSYSDVSILSENNSEYEYSTKTHYETTNKTNCEINYDIDYDTDINRIRDMYDRNSLYTMSLPNTSNDNDNNYDNDDLYSIINFYTQSYAEVDNKVIEPVMQLPLSSNQLMLMKRQWDKQLDIDLTKTVPKQRSLFSVYSRSSNESPIPRNSHFSEISNKSEKSTKSTKSWKSFFSKFSKKNKKTEIKFYDNLTKHI